MEGKRNRGDNLLYEHKLFLLELIEIFLHLLEDKKTDARTSAQKQKVWLQIKDSFQSVHGFTRDIEGLKGMWKRLKLRAKTEFRDFKKHKNGTGGGPSAEEPSFLSKRIEELLPRDFTSLVNPYDDDDEPTFTSTPIVSKKVKCSTESYQTRFPARTSTLDDSVDEKRETSTSTGESNFSVVDLCSPSTSDHQSASQDKFIIRKRQSRVLPDLDEGLSAVGKSKKEKISENNSRKQLTLEEKGKECMEAEHRLKMKCMEEEHIKKLAYMKEEHDIKMKILKTQEKILFVKLNNSSDTSNKNYSDMSDFITASDTVLHGSFY